MGGMWNEIKKLRRKDVRSVRKSSRCMPSDFPGKDSVTAFMMSRAVNLFFKHNGDWSEVTKDYAGPSRRQLAGFLKDPEFMMQVEAFSIYKTAEMESVIMNEAKNGDSSAARISAADKYLQAKKPEEWDRGVRKQIVANKGSVSNSYMTANITVNNFYEALSRDPALSIDTTSEESTNVVQSLPGPSRFITESVGQADEPGRDHEVAGSGGESIPGAGERSFLKRDGEG
jgi:hypothetical protein